MRKHSKRLDIKCFAWTAGFPNINAEAILPKTEEGQTKQQEISHRYANDPEIGQQLLRREFEEDSQNYILDFYGPSFDIAFRIGKYASPQHMPISLELAYLLATTMIYANEVIRFGQDTVHKPRGKDHPYDKIALRLHYKERVDLKGVLEGEPYPLFWIHPLHKESRDELDITEKALSHAANDSPSDDDNAKIIRFCRAFIDEVETKSIMTLPYIQYGNERVLEREAPKEHKENRKKQIEKYIPAVESFDKLAEEAADKNGDEEVAQKLTEANSGSSPITPDNHQENMPTPSKNKDDAIQALMDMQEQLVDHPSDSISDE
uniref:Uncharacterized protein n=1 Tax=Magnetococcus massalia (strain MO-1) TaxID=451514 RepID=A0A1S7LKH9_MAGMO|nr:protein of unknown function [Candidatus Magnetococcus massalia]